VTDLAFKFDIRYDRETDSKLESDTRISRSIFIREKEPNTYTKTKTKTKKKKKKKKGELPVPVLVPGTVLVWRPG
jgi:hypothetical protein